MKRSQLFTKTSKTAPADEVAKNAQLLIRAGFVAKEMAGVYDLLPLGLKVRQKIENLIRAKMNKAGAQELIMTNLQPKETWETTTRWDDKVVDIWFKTKLQDSSEIGLAWSHEEPIVKMLSRFVESYKDLPVAVYQFQTKLRNEIRAKSGLMRGREFVMKDLYSLHSSREDLDAFYNKMVEVYQEVFADLGLGGDTYVTYASGGAFTDFSHEFQTVCEAGEDEVYLHNNLNDGDKKVAINAEMIENDKVAAELKKLGIDKNDMKKVKTAEVGNIFNFSTEKTDSMGLYYTDSDGQRQSIYMGSYGIGITRLMGVIAEKMSDERGLVWPENIAPARVYLANIGDDDGARKFTTEIYEKLSEAGIEAIWDDRLARPGEKFADADLLGIPWRVVVSLKLAEQGLVELKPRTSDEIENLSIEKLIEKLTK